MNLKLIYEMRENYRVYFRIGQNLIPLKIISRRLPLGGIQR